MPAVPLPAAVLFDFDGVLVDSERLHHETMVDAMAGMGPDTPWEFYRDHLMGLDDRGAFALLLQRAGLPPHEDDIRRLTSAKALLFARHAADGRVPSLPGSPDFVRACAARCPVGLCSGALRSDVVPVLASLGLADVFSAIVTAEDVPASKPDPASYTLCLHRLALRFPQRPLPPSACVAIEDTVDGIASARAAGLPVLALTTNLPADVLRQAGAGDVVNSLQNLSPDRLASLCCNPRSNP